MKAYRLEVSDVFNNEFEGRFEVKYFLKKKKAEDYYKKKFGKQGKYFEMEITEIEIIE